MRNLAFLNLLLVIAVVCSCTEDDADDMGDLQEQLNELLALSQSVDCTNPDDWRFAGLGAKPCGGPTDYIAYSIRMDTVDFLDKLNAYNKAVKAFNEREGLISDCALEPPPLGVQCRDGIPVLIYSACELEPRSGPCFALIRRYYFDKEEQQCKEFIWGGCNGTVPFETMEDCRECEGN